MSPPTELVRMIEPPWPPASSAGTPAFTVFQTPGKVDVDHLLSSLFRWFCPELVSPPLLIPALATMMSSRPSCSTPLSTAAFECVVVTHIDFGGDDSAVVAL